MAIDVSKKTSGSIEEVTRRLVLTGDAVKSTMEFLSIRSQYFRDIMCQGIDIS